MYQPFIYLLFTLKCWNTVITKNDILECALLFHKRKTTIEQIVHIFSELYSLHTSNACLLCQNQFKCL